MYSTKDFEKPYLQTANRSHQNVDFTTESLSQPTAEKARGYQAVSIFAGDDASGPVIRALHSCGVKYIAVRAAGYDNVDLQVAQDSGISVANVPAYSPYAIAEHAVALLLALNRKIIYAWRQGQQHNFTVGNLVGMDLRGKTVGIIGTGKIGGIFAEIMYGFGCHLLGYDAVPDEDLTFRYGLNYVSLEDLCSRSDVISLHLPYNSRTRHLIGRAQFSCMKPGAIFINTARGGVVQTGELLKALEEKQIAACGLDVYENERGIFFYDHSRGALHDDMLERLLRMPNVIITPHQAFATHEALQNIADTTFENLDAWNGQTVSGNELTPAPMPPQVVHSSL